ncbi:hypothetical protein QE449_001096 [Rhodococcus sp. SORGH_AS303]|nr:hypothetical protein [Rhodococcus sp. SORGH_AS_0303]
MLMLECLKRTERSAELSSGLHIEQRAPNRIYDVALLDGQIHGHVVLRESYRGRAAVGTPPTPNRAMACTKWKFCTFTHAGPHPAARVHALCRERP